VRRRSRVNVTKGEDAIGARHLIGRQLSGHDLAEKAVGHVRAP
jgi:hypothetical protein